MRAEGMVFCKLLLSPMPHARVTSIDTSDALAMEGVFGVLTADDVPAGQDANEVILTNNPHSEFYRSFVGHKFSPKAATPHTRACFDSYP